MVQRVHERHEMRRYPSLPVLGAALALSVIPPIWRAEAQPRPAVQDAPQVAFGGPFSLTDQNGMRRTEKDFRGKYMLVFFGYTYCPDVCPTTLAVEAEALGKLGARAGRVVPIFITVDPKRDTAQKLKPYLASFGPGFVGLTGTDAEISQVAQAYRIYYRAHLDGRAANSANYSVDHTGNVYLMGPDGKFVAYYAPGILPDELTTDLMRKVPPG